MTVLSLKTEPRLKGSKVFHREINLSDYCSHKVFQISNLLASIPTFYNTALYCKVLFVLDDS